MGIPETEEERALREKNLEDEQKKQDESLKSEFTKDMGIDVAIDQAEGIANIAIPLEEFQIFMKILKAIDKAVNQEQGIMR
jgi:hypothetical protein